MWSLVQSASLFCGLLLSPAVLGGPGCCDIITDVNERLNVITTTLGEQFERLN